MGKWGLFFMMAILLAACGPDRVVKDRSPLHPTAVTESQVHNFGFKGMFASEKTEIVRTRPEMERTDHEFAFTGSVMKLISRSSSTAKIERVDRNLLWELDKKEKRYTECPLGGCPLLKGESRPEPTTQEGSTTLESSREPSCPLRLEKNVFSVNPTGEKRVVNGFDSEEYIATWEVVLEDEKKMKDTSTFTFTIWTTPETAQIREVVKIQEAYRRAYLEKVAQKVMMDDASIGRVLPKEANEILITYFFGVMSEQNRRALLKAAEEFGKIKGYPISTKVEWKADARACRPDEPEKVEQKEEKEIDFSGGIGGIVSGLAGKMVEKKVEEKMKEGEGKPIFGFVKEVKAIKLEPVSDGLFQPSSDYKLSNRN
ncbi:MAG: hypothetical protein WBK96_16840 [Candidatus Manganitrophaceae bacterium]